MAQANIRAVITAEDRASAVVGGFGSSFSRMTAAVGTGLAVFSTLRAATLGVVDVFKDSIEAFQKQELATTRLQAGIQNVKTATDKNIDGLLKQASALERVTRFSDEATISAQGILSTFQLNQRAITMLTPRLQDMSEGLARVTGEMPDLEGNAILVAKALGGEDVAGLVGALRRVGVVMTATQTEILKTGDLETRLQTITQVLDQNFRGLAEAAGTTSAGKMAILQNALNNLQEQFGAALSDALMPFIGSLTKWAQSDQARATIQEIANKVAAMIKAFVIFMKENWPEIKSALQTMATVAWGVVRAIDAIGDAVRKLGGLKGILKTIPGINAIAGFRQMGGPVFGGKPYVVGEKGPELFVPNSGGRIVANDKMQVGSGMSQNITVNISPNIGMYAGTPLERRKLAEQILADLRDVASSKGVNLTALVAR